MPITGMDTAPATSYTMRRATGNTAGPDRPPVRLASRGLLRPRVNPHAEQGINQAQTVRAGLLAGSGNGHNIRNVRAELDIDRLGCDRLDRRRHGRGALRRCPEAEPAAVDVRTAHVHFR